MSKLKWIQDELNDLNIINSKNNLTKKGKELILEYEYVLKLEKLFKDFSDIDIESIFSKILSFYVPDGNPEIFKLKIEQYKSELLSL